MIKLDTINKIEKYQDGRRHVQVSVTSDTAAEIKAAGTDGSLVEGLLNSDIMTAHSDCFTVDQQLLILGSDGQWK